MRGAAEERERRRALLQLDRVVLGNRASILFSPTCVRVESRSGKSAARLSTLRPFHRFGLQLALEQSDASL